ncbi:MAG: hypothetical protein ACJ79P_09690, partial [Myxococcales bacterium]
WAQVPAADSYLVSRQSFTTPLAPLAEVTGVSFLDSSAPAEPQIYFVQSRNAAGLSLLTEVLATPFPASDQSNPGTDPLGTTALDDAHSPAQTFVVGTGGVLEGIEVSMSCLAPAGCEPPTVEIDSGDVRIATARAFFLFFQLPCCGTPSPLPDGFHGSTYFPFADPVPVSAGQHLRVVVDSAAPMLAGTTGDLYAGGSLEEGGRPAPDRDLAFRTEVLPASGNLTQPAVPRLIAGVGQVEVVWTPVPLATGYTVLRSTDGSNFTVAGTTLDAFFLDTNVVPGRVFYQVQATGSGVPRVSPTGSLTLPAWSLAASNLGVTGARDATEALGQTFTAEKTGDIFEIDLALSAAPGGTATRAAFFVDLLDEAGTLLATSFEGFGRVASCCGQPPDLSAGRRPATFASFFPAVPVTAGQRLEFRLRPQTPLVAGTSADVYGGGTLTAGGIADPSRDLAFKVVEQ